MELHWTQTLKYVIKEECWRHKTLWARQQKNFQHSVCLFTHICFHEPFVLQFSQKKNWRYLNGVFFWQCFFEEVNLTVAVPSHTSSTDLHCQYVPAYLLTPCLFFMSHSDLICVTPCLSGFCKISTVLTKASPLLPISSRDTSSYTQKNAQSYMIDNRKTKKGKIIF